MTLETLAAIIAGLGFIGWGAGTLARHGEVARISEGVGLVAAGAWILLQVWP